MPGKEKWPSAKSNSSTKKIRKYNQSGLTLVELLIVMVILGVMIASLSQALSAGISFYNDTRGKQDLVFRASYAMARMVMFVQEAREFEVHGSGALWVQERISDAYDNATGAYLPGGDGFLDTDRDADGLVDEGGGDNIEWVQFIWQSADQRLVERFPDYATAEEGDHVADRVLCENVTLLRFTRMQDDLLEIALTLQNGNHEVSLKTRAYARTVK